MKPWRPFESRRSRRTSFRGGSGHELAGIVDEPLTDGDAQPPVVVIGHCFTCNKDLKAIVRLGRLLAGAGIGVLRFDMTGLGGSEGDFSQTDFSSNVADLRAAVAAAESELGPVTGLLGHSFGGAACLAVAGESSGPPPALAAVATLAAPSDTHHLADLLERMNPAIAREGIGDVEIGGRRWTIRSRMLDDFRSFRLSECIARLPVPLLILHSPADETLDYRHALRLFEAASARGPLSSAHDPPTTSLVALDGADHLLAQRAGDLQFAAGLIAAFFHHHRRRTDGKS